MLVASGDEPSEGVVVEPFGAVDAGSLHEGAQQPVAFCGGLLLRQGLRCADVGAGTASGNGVVVVGFVPAEAFALIAQSGAIPVAFEKSAVLVVGKPDLSPVFVINALNFSGFAVGVGAFNEGGGVFLSQELSKQVALLLRLPSFCVGVPTLDKGERFACYQQ